MQQNTQRVKQRLTTAEGYIELGMLLDANAELEEINPEQRDANEVLTLRLQIYAALQKWELLQVVAKSLVVRDPMSVQPWVSLAYAVRRTTSLVTAKAVLVEAIKGLPDAAILHYNLACYECQLGNLEEAKDRLRRSFELEPKLRPMALEEEDLEAVWNFES